MEAQPGNGRGTPLALKDGTILTRKDFNELRNAFAASIRQLSKIYAKAFKNPRGKQGPSKTATIPELPLVQFILAGFVPDANGRWPLAPLQREQFPLLSSDPRAVSIANRNMLKDLLTYYSWTQKLAGNAPVNRGKNEVQWTSNRNVPDALMMQYLGPTIERLAQTSKPMHNRTGQVIGQTFNPAEGLPYTAWNQIVSALTRDPANPQEAAQTTNRETNQATVAEANRERALVRQAIDAFKAGNAGFYAQKEQAKKRAQAEKRSLERQANLHVNLPQ